MRNSLRVRADSEMPKRPSRSETSPQRRLQACAGTRLDDPDDARAVAVDGREQRAQTGLGGSDRAGGGSGRRSYGRRRHDTALTQLEERAADFAAGGAGGLRLHSGEHRGRLDGRDFCEGADDRGLGDTDDAAQFVETGDRVGRRGGGIEAELAQFRVFEGDVTGAVIFCGCHLQFRS